MDGPPTRTLSGDHAPGSNDDVRRYRIWTSPDGLSVAKLDTQRDGSHESGAKVEIEEVDAGD
jgi:hypothetical protein